MNLWDLVVDLVMGAGCILAAYLIFLMVRDELRDARKRKEEEGD